MVLTIVVRVHSLPPIKQNSTTMEFINKIELCGIVGTSNIEIVNTKTKLTTLTVCVNTVYNSPDGMAVVDTTWFKVSVWDAKEQFAQGQWVSLTGRLRQRRYIDSANNERIMYDVVAQEIHTLKVEQNETL